MHHGVAEERVEAMSAAERLAAYIAHGEFEGGEWDWSRMKWKAPKK